MTRKGIYLFSIDVEDDRTAGAYQETFSGRVPGNVDRYLDFLKRHRAHSTFFVLGNIARKYPAMLRKIEDHGHEIACHSDKHIPVTDMSEAAFREDIELNLAAIADTGVARPSGYRAPCFSISGKTPWVYPVLKEKGFTYSSSVLPAASPLYGWEQFSQHPTYYQDTLWEIPASLSGTPLVNVPFAGGIYFRVLPAFWVNNRFRKFRESGDPVVGYFHPYDIDSGQSKKAFPEFDDKPLFRLLMFHNRSRVFTRLEKVLQQNFDICRYDHFVSHHLERTDA